MVKVGMDKLSEVVRQAKVGNPSVSVTYHANALAGDKKLRFIGSVVVGKETYVICGDNGKQKVFTDVDDFVKSLATAAPTSSGDYPVIIVTGTLLAQKPPANIAKANAARVVRLAARDKRLSAIVAALDAELVQMAGWESGNALQAARKAAVQEQRAVVVEEQAAVMSIIASLQP